jgi:hypothetical protein
LVMNGELKADTTANEEEGSSAHRARKGRYGIKAQASSNA